MDHIDEAINKISHPSRRARAVKASKISRLDSSEIKEQINALQRAFALERGENHKFREEIRALFRLRF
jgi:hypothetical protein